jgi:hypothetical protein
VDQIYSGFENIFKHVAATFENYIEKDYWHKSLLRRMTLEIEGIRPSLISKESFTYINNLRAFRHFFRHAYDCDIDKDKFKIIADSVFKIKDMFKKELEDFTNFLNLLLKE